MISFDQIRKIHIELTTRCNARCPMCMRNYRGYEFNSGYPDCELTLADFKKIITPVVIQHVMQPTHGVLPKNQGFNFNGNLGDFASAHDALEIVDYLIDHQAKITVNTNGSLRTPAWWEKLARPGVEIGFALDGLEDTHHLYRQDTNWHKIIKNAQAFINNGGHAVWRFIPFDHNRHQEQQCRDLAAQLGFKRFENIYDGRESSPVFKRDGEFSHQIGKPLTFVDFPPKLDQLLPSIVTWFDAKTIQVTADQPNLKLSCTHKINREIYIAADGSVYPCCYLGFYPETMTHAGNDQLKPLVRENNALAHSLEHCLTWFDAVEQTWQKKSIADGRLYQCVSNCGRL
jgi:MoaA/NifB/PqqE/SkfB family radical SAM enzyme